MNKRELEKHRKENERLEKMFQKNELEAKEAGRKRKQKTEKQLERRAIQRQKEWDRLQKRGQKLVEKKTQYIEQADKKEADKEIKKALRRKPKKNPSDFKGYAYDRKNDAYRVQFAYKGKKYRLGRYATKEEAHAVYLVERAKIEGEQ